MHTWVDVVAVYGLRAAVLIFLAGTAWRVLWWLRRPVPRQVVLTPAPSTRLGVLFFMLHESLLFTTLFKASRWTWLFGWMFHVGLTLVLLQHLRYLTAQWWQWIGWLASWGHVASAMMIVGLLGLIARRLCVDRLRYISRPSDHLWLVLLVVIAVSGVALKYQWPMNVVAVKEFVRGALLMGETVALPMHPALLVHVLLAVVLLGVFPFGKLLHGPGLWINPTRAQADAQIDNRRRDASD